MTDSRNNFTLKDNVMAVALGVVFIVVGFLATVVLLQFLIEGQVEEFSLSAWYTFPKILFYLMLLATWFVGGFYVSSKVRANRILSTIIAGFISGFVLLIDWWLLIALVVISVIGGSFGLLKADEEQKKSV